MSFDVKITGGLVYDGDGGEPVRANIGVKDGRIAEIGRCEADAERIIDAGGAIVTPGFVDLHTHYDGQISWDEEMRPSVNFGVTTTTTLPSGGRAASSRRAREPSSPGAAVGNRSTISLPAENSERTLSEATRAGQSKPRSTVKDSRSSQPCRSAAARSASSASLTSSGSSLENR